MNYSRGASHIAVAASASVAILIAAAGAQAGAYFGTSDAQKLPLAPIERPTYVEISDADKNGIPDWQEELAKAGIATIEPATSTATSSASLDPLSRIAETVAKSLFGNYLFMKENGAYSAQEGQKMAENVAATVIKAPETYVRHTEAELKFDSNTSADRILVYRSDMRVATERLLEGTEPEFALFGRYMESGDPYWLEELEKTVARYRETEKRMLKVTVPENARIYHIRAVNAVGAYGNNIDRLIRFAGDPIAVLALLRAYNDVEREMLLAFDALANFYARSASPQN